MIEKVIDLLRGILSLTNPKRWGPFIEAFRITDFDHAFSISWSQGGEDLALLQVFEGITNGSYIDVGAHNPSRFSVTRHLYQRGWSGVNIEANEELMQAFKIKRPRDINICSAVGTKTSYSFSVFEEAALSTIDQEWEARYLVENQKIRSRRIVPGISLRRVLETYFTERKCNLLNIDAEGSDNEVIDSIEFGNINEKYHPEWILIETNPPVNNVLNTQGIQKLIKEKYEPYLILTMSTLLRKNYE